MWRQAIRSDELYHYGRLGMHWGERNGPPYPLDREIAARISKRGNEERQQRYKERQDKIKSGKIKAKGRDKIGSRYMSDDRDSNIVPIMVDYKEPNNHDVKKFSDYSGRYSTRSYATAIRLAKEEGDDSAYRINNKYKVNNPDGTITTEALKKINLGQFGQPGYSNNCTKCSAALAMQQMGYNCSAGGSLSGASYDAYEYWFNDAEKHTIKGIDVDKTLESQGPGAYGVIAMGRGRYSEAAGKVVRTGGHEVFYKVGNDGNVTFYDGQSGEIDKTWADTNARCAANMNIEAVSYRLDKATPNLSAMDDDGVISTPGRRNTAFIDKWSKHVYSKY